MTRAHLPGQGQGRPGRPRTSADPGVAAAERQFHSISFRKASRSGRLARARARWSIDRCRGVQPLSVGWPDATQRCLAIAVGGFRPSVSAKCLVRKHSWHIGCQISEIEFSSAIRRLVLCRAGGTNAVQQKISSKVRRRHRRLVAILSPPCRPFSQDLPLSYPAAYRNRNISGASQAIEPTYITQLALAFAATKIGRFIRRYILLRDLRNPAESTSEIIRVNIASRLTPLMS